MGEKVRQHPRTALRCAVRTRDDRPHHGEEPLLSGTALQPSIADPFLPNKIESGLIDDIRECIGCNICVSGDLTMSAIRCTQNPTMGEEWRRGWHPEDAPPALEPESVLVVGAGPAGLEVARTLGHRDCSVTLLEAGRELGGRVRRESALPGLSAWIRVVDYREQQLSRLDSVEIHRQSPVSVDDVLEFGFAHVFIATGATWRADGVGRSNHYPIPIADGANVLTPDDIMSGVRPSGSRVVVFDDDHYYMAGILAELLASEGFSIAVVCPKPQVSAWTSNTLEVDRIQARLLNGGIVLHNNQSLVAVDSDAATVQCAYTGAETVLAADSVVLVTARQPNDDLYRGLEARVGEWRSAGVHSVRRIGDADAPSTIAAAVYAGHKAGREFDRADADLALATRREVTALSDDFPPGDSVNL